MPHAPQTLGMSQYPGGYEMYRRPDGYLHFRDATPEEVHAIGYRALQETQDKMRDIMKQVGFQGTLEEFTRSVQEDPQFKFKTPEEMQETLTGYLEKIKPILPRYFNRMPKADCAVRQHRPKTGGYHLLGVLQCSGGRTYRRLLLQCRRIRQALPSPCQRGDLS